MRRYAVMRTDKNVRSFILREFEQGRLRQGWGWKAEHDLRLLRQKIAARTRLTDEERSVWRNRRLLDTESDGLRMGDVIISPNLPEQGRWVIARVSGAYTFELSNESTWSSQDYGHILPVTPVRTPAGKVAVIEADNAHVDARLRASMRSMSRMWSVDHLAPAIDRMIAAAESGEDTAGPQPEAAKFDTFFAAMRRDTWRNIVERYKGAEFEHLIRRLFERIYAAGSVEHWGGAGENGADLIVYTPDPLGLEYKIAVQVKLHDRLEDDLTSLNQIRRARDHHRVDAGVIVTTALDTADGFQAALSRLQAELGIDIRVITRDELTELLMRHLGADHGALTTGT